MPDKLTLNRKLGGDPLHQRLRTLPPGLARVGALELHVRSPLRAPEAEAAGLGPSQRPAAKAFLRKRRRRRRRDRVREERHEARRSSAFSIVSTAARTTFRPR